MKIAIVGGGAAAFEAASAARRQDAAAEITVYSREKVPPYRRPALSGMVAHELDDSRFLIKGADFYAREKIDLRLGVEVAALDVAARTLKLADGGTAAFDKVVLATGARPFVPPVPGLDKPGVAVLRDYADLEDLRARLAAETCRRATVLGGGVLGLELAASLLERGLEVTVVENAPTILPRNLDADAGRAVMDYLKSVPKLALRFGVSAAGWDGETLALSDGTKVETDLLCVSAGVRADTKLAAAAGLPCGRGITVDETMRVPDFGGVYAAGDAAECNGRGCGLYNTARAMGQTAGTNAAGGSAVFAPEATPVRLAVFGLKIFSAGDVSGAGTGGGDAANYRKLFHDRDGKLRGAILMGNLSEALKLQSEIAQ